ncbi:hypothetical protein W97_08119 [Coniosporium apollinis CBS 100218]|uniref:DUF7598 domain-containing protein n=1 Tax=Coniosporium apollinis (strain CBS 100218) TaxID=1168221 RepID=R7Z4J3_CONA1|nr:uncharacterized protein W97_08119 [Coniosporium apollinis CBS 100218]EON68861.1 hypothetical protein W97_08119 [Coniosporium apollinis CBS 100218]
MPLSSKSLAGPGYIILNALRVMNIISLLAIIAASVVMLIKTSTKTQFFFFDAINHVVATCTCMFLITSEVSLFRNYFAHEWPVLGSNHGFVALGLAMVVLGVNVLGHLNKESLSQENMGLAFWRIVLAAGVLAFIIGLFNVIASYIFRDTSLNITARRVRSHGAVAIRNSNSTSGSPPRKSLSISTASIEQHTFGHHSPAFKSPISLRSPFKNFSPAKTFRAARDSILPSYHANMKNAPAPYASSPTSEYSQPMSKKGARESVGPRIPINISAPTNPNPAYAHLVRPEVAKHPSERRGEGNMF